MHSCSRTPTVLFMFYALLSFALEFTYLVFKFTPLFFNCEMDKYSKLNDCEIKNILIEIPGDDGGLTDLEDEVYDIKKITIRH